MKAVTWHGVGDVRLEDVPDPRIVERTDAIVRVRTSAICGTDLHFVRGTMPGLEPGVVLGHEGVGEVVEVGSGVRNFQAGDRVVVPSMPSGEANSTRSASVRTSGASTRCIGMASAKG
ncbi:alcohol dehydrogenase catalytic domain-containing protein [Actinomycetes bacterium KLBMP 9797]